MNDPLWTEEYARLVRHARPDIEPVHRADLDKAWVGIARSMKQTPIRPRRRLRIIAGAGVAAIIGIGGVAAADMFSAHTGTYNQGWEIGAGGPGEVLEPRAPDYGSVIHEVVADVPFPDQEARDISWATQKRESKGGVLSTGALRGFTADDAICSWANAWAAATTGGDQTGRQAAIAALDDAATWPAVTDMDAEQEVRRTKVQMRTRSGSVSGTGWADDSTRFGYLTLVRAASRNSDVEAMGKVLAERVRCIPALMPNLQQALPRLER